MEIQGYKFKSYPGRLEFQFYSVGPKGKIKKAVMFAPAEAQGTIYYNLSFGDWDEENMRINYWAVTNNNDSQKVLKTVASIILKFTEHFRNFWVFAQGSTPARTRLYQMNIAANWNEISRLLHVKGYTKGKWEQFVKGKNFEAFMAKRKKL